MENYIIGICLFGSIIHMGFLVVLYNATTTQTHNNPANNDELDNEETEPLIQPEYNYIV